VFPETRLVTKTRWQFGASGGLRFEAALRGARPASTVEHVPKRAQCAHLAYGVVMG
jgi:hypothetical protein